ncbi:hypothetical protein [Glycomyces tritici]|uniref:PE-PGRS family protein n=1 Tax=Glycomyces tritici TaxID=2665176 RepID=A0ABT7YJA4_9ACTN|nr:hypothetical protein [Glycomyces tritici]MDN3238680.1 hypothetical protein [Glycomyces tritici]
MKSAYPYPTLFGDITVDVASVTVDGAGLPYSCISRTEQTVALHLAGRERWSQATLQLDASLPEQELAEGPWSEVTCVAVLSEKGTNARTTTRLTHSVDGRRSGSIELPKSFFRNRATLTLMTVGTVDGTSGRILGTADRPWYVDLMAAVPTREREININEVDFRSGELEWLRPYADSPWIVETSGEEPAVHLNTGAIEGLMDILHGKGGPIAERTLRETTASQIAQDTWIALFHAAASGLEADEDGTPVMPDGWRESVLRMMLPDVLPGRSLGDALREIERRRQGIGWAELQTNIQYAAGKRSRIARRLTDAVRSVNRMEKEGAR